MTAFYMVLSGAAAALISALAGVYNKRRGSPDAQTQLMNATVLLVKQLQDRVAALEKRLDEVEEENRKKDEVIQKYSEEYGPLPE